MLYIAVKFIPEHLLSRRSEQKCGQKENLTKDGMLEVSGNELSQELDFAVLSESESVNTEQVCNEFDPCLEEIREG